MSYCHLEILYIYILYISYIYIYDMAYNMICLPYERVQTEHKEVQFTVLKEKL
jgi:hypothetical protein